MPTPSGLLIDRVVNLAGFVDETKMLINTMRPIRTSTYPHRRPMRDAPTLIKSCDMLLTTHLATRCAGDAEHDRYSPADRWRPRCAGRPVIAYDDPPPLSTATNDQRD